MHLCPRAKGLTEIEKPPPALPEAAFLLWDQGEQLPLGSDVPGIGPAGGDAVKPGQEFRGFGAVPALQTGPGVFGPEDGGIAPHDVEDAAGLLGVQRLNGGGIAPEEL